MFITLNIFSLHFIIIQILKMPFLAYELLKTLFWIYYTWLQSKCWKSFRFQREKKIKIYLGQNDFSQGAKIKV